MTGVETIARNRFEHFQNRKGIKRIARELGVARDTVRKVLRPQVTVFSYKRASRPLPKIGPWVETLTGQPPCLPWAPRLPARPRQDASRPVNKDYIASRPIALIRAQTSTYGTQNSGACLHLG